MKFFKQWQQEIKEEKNRRAVKLKRNGKIYAESDVKAEIESLKAMPKRSLKFLWNLIFTTENDIMNNKVLWQCLGIIGYWHTFQGKTEFNEFKMDVAQASLKYQNGRLTVQSHPYKEYKEVEK